MVMIQSQWRAFTMLHHPRISFQPRYLSAKVNNNDYIVKSPYKATSIPEINLYSYVFQHFSKYGKKIALIDSVTRRGYSYNEIQESVVNMASGLVRNGMQKGDVLAIVSPNSGECCTMFFSILAVGGAVAFCSPNYPVEDLAYQFKNSDSKYIATTPTLLPTMQEAARKAGCVKKVIVLGNEGGIGEEKNVISFQSLVKDSGSKFPHDLKLDPRSNTAVISYSSGTTGYPKGIVMSHYNIISCLVQLEHGSLLSEYYLEGRILSAIPFFQMSAMLGNMMCGLRVGSKLVTLPKFEPELFLHTVSQYKATYTTLFPPLILFLANSPMVDKYNLSSLKHISYGSAPTGSKLAAKVKKRLNLKYCQQGFGTTETGITHLMPLDMLKPESVGVPLAYNLCKIVDDATGAALGPNTSGELVLQGPQVMRGYLKNPEATKAAVKHGWFHTGDLGYYDKDGYFYITERLIELINVRGYKVAPAELEAILLQHPSISDAAVIGVDNEETGEAPQAFVVRNSDKLSEQEVEEFVKARLSEPKQLKGGVKFINEIPKSPSGKILRRLLKK